MVRASSPWCRPRTCCHSCLPFLNVFLQTDGRLVKTLSWDFHVKPGHTSASSSGLAPAELSSGPSKHCRKLPGFAERKGKMGR